MYTVSSYDLVQQQQIISSVHLYMANNHTQTCSGWAALDDSGKITPYVFKRRENGDTDVTIEIMYCGMCHTDVNFAKNDWGITNYPLVPGYEITGLITKVGKNVRNFKVGDKAGMGCLGATCLNCDCCKNGLENYCDQVQFTYNGIFWDGTPMYGGYSKFIVADHRYVIRWPENLPMDSGAPLLCAGISVYCPLIDNLTTEDPKRIAVVGLGGLGHLALKFGKAMGHHVSVISTSPSKEKEARERFGADDFILSTDPKQMQSKRRALDLIVDTVTAKHDLGPLLELLEVNGTLVIIGVPDQPIDLPAFPLILGKRVVKGSMLGSMKETQEMIDVCAQRNITCDIELISTDQINEAFDRILKNDVKYRFVIDIAGKSKL